MDVCQNENKHKSLLSTRRTFMFFAKIFSISLSLIHTDRQKDWVRTLSCKKKLSFAKPSLLNEICYTWSTV